jgi:hypothetical protein
MDKTYFVVSDIHGFYDELIAGLARAGYDKENPEHVLIVNGDIFDRGPKNLEVFKFLKELPKERRVLIRGNHEDMFLYLIKRNFPYHHDFSNKTVNTFCQIAGYSEEPLHNFYAMTGVDEGINTTDYWAQIKETVKLHKIDKWLESDEWVNYFETGRFIITHSFIPTSRNDYIPGWRDKAVDYEWEKSRWGNPYESYRTGLFKPEEEAGKILVFGHWYTSEIRAFAYELEYSTDTSIVDYKGFIAIDGGVWKKQGELYHPVNVLIIKGNEYTKNNG